MGRRYDKPGHGDVTDTCVTVALIDRGRFLDEKWNIGMSESSLLV